MGDLADRGGWTEEVIRVRLEVLPAVRGDLRVLAFDADRLADAAPEHAQRLAWRKVALAAQRAFLDLAETEVEVR